MSDDACPMPQPSDAPDRDQLRAMLADARTVAVVGASPKADRTSHHIVAWLLQHTPYTVIPVNPVAAGQTIEGVEIVASLEDIEGDIDIVDVFRRGELTPEVAQAAVEHGAKNLWLQLGVMSDESRAIADDAGLGFVQNRCIKVEYSRLQPHS